MSVLRTLIFGPRPLHPRLLKALMEISTKPIRDYINILKRIYILHLKSPHGETAILELSDSNHLFQLLELQSFGIKIDSYDPQKGIITLNLYGDVFCIRPLGYHIEGVLHMFRDKIYGEDFQDRVVLDVGAFTGDSAISFVKMGARRVIAVEPSPSVLDILRRNVLNSRYKDRIEVLPVSISDYDGSSILFTNKGLEGAEYLSDFHNTDFYSSIFTFEAQSPVTVQVWSFKRLVEYVSEEIDIVKLDCKGAEYPIILNTDAETLQCVRRYIVAYHAGPERLVRRLESLGYRVHLRPAAPGYEQLFPTAGTIFADRK